ncbi:MAG: DEAD/DEAH box helicase [Nocardioidaceae bacterium]|nr:DEAD/DEAH box helicase [Nocardioidaceae bacterium]
MTLPIALTGTDMIGQARTGTGKTLAFGIPVLQRTVAMHDPDYAELVAPGKPQALIVAPTRELALQVAGDIETSAKRRGTRSVTIYGGVPYEPQLEALENGVDVVVGTPGRLLDLSNRRALDLGHVKVMVLDEADEMLDLGFLPDVEKLIAKTPETRQTMLFSATMPGAIVSLARTHMRHPVNIRAESGDESEMVPATAQFVFRAHDLDKPEVIARILQAEDSGKVIIFTRTKRQAQRVADDLIERGFPASPLHGDMAQVAREKAMARFREGKTPVLVATDVAARGIDVSGVTHVMNYHCPDDHKTYLHRIGRTGRAGASGIAITFVDWNDIARWQMINRELGLPFDEPQETYSTSEHLYHDLGIPPGVTGRVGPPAAGPARESSRPRRGQETGTQGGQRPARSRSRQRTRGGAPVLGESATAPATAASTAAADVEAAPDSSSAAQPTRQRRRRPRSGQASGGEQAAPPAGD